jgi:hypothetical protein
MTCSAVPSIEVRVSQLHVAASAMLSQALPATATQIDEIAAYKVSVPMLTAAHMREHALAGALVARMLQLLHFESLSTLQPSSTVLLVVDQWIARNAKQTIQLVRVAWLLGRVTSALRVLCADAPPAATLPSPAAVAAVCRALLVAGASATGDAAPLRAWATLYALDPCALSFDDRAHMLQLLAAIATKADRLWAGAMALQVAAMAGDAAFYMRVSESLLQVVEPRFVAFSAVFTAGSAAANAGGSIVHLREPLIPRHNESAGFVNAVRRFSSFERRLLVGKRLLAAAQQGGSGAGSALPLLAPRLAAMAHEVPIGDFRCWWLAVLADSARRIGDASLVEAAHEQLRADLSSAQLGAGDALLAMAIVSLR